MSSIKIPSAFVSYSHDSQDHKRWVLELASRLRNVGIDASLDQWDLKPGDDLPVFMERHLVKADRVIMVCTDNYVVKANSGTGGVGYEKMVVTADLMKSIDSNKVIPIVRQKGSRNVPTFLATKLYIDFSTDDEYESAFDDLTRAIHNAPLYAKPEIANNPFAPIAPAQKTGDAVLKLMTEVVNTFEAQPGDAGHMLYEALLSRWAGSRVMFDLVLDEAEQNGLLKQHSGGYISLTPRGKVYAVENKIVVRKFGR